MGEQKLALRDFKRRLALRDFKVSGLVTRHARNGISDVQRETSWGPGSV
jgi:hypothetical protein